MNKIERQLNIILDARYAEIEKRLSHEVIEKQMDAFGYIRPVLFAKLLRFKWMKLMERN